MLRPRREKVCTTAIFKESFKYIFSGECRYLSKMSVSWTRSAFLVFMAFNFNVLIQVFVCKRKQEILKHTNIVLPYWSSVVNPSFQHTFFHEFVSELTGSSDSQIYQNSQKVKILGHSYLFATGQLLFVASGRRRSEQNTSFPVSRYWSYCSNNSVLWAKIENDYCVHCTMITQCADWFSLIIFEIAGWLSAYFHGGI